MRGAGYLTTNSDTAWPFDENDPALDRSVARMFADGSVTLEPQEAGAEAFVSDVSVTDGVLSFVVSKRTPHGGAGVDESSRVDVPVGDGPYSVTGSSWFFFVIDSGEVARNDGMSWHGPQFRIAADAVGTEAERVRSLSLYNMASPGVLEPIVFGIRGDVTIREGNNMTVSAGPQDESGKPFGIVLSAGAGLGAGTVPCADSGDCPDEAQGGGRGSVRPDAEGNVVIESDQCYQVSPDEHRRTLSQHGDGFVHILVSGRCTACCQCDDFVRLNDRLADESELVLKSYDDLMYSRSLYEDKAVAWNAEIGRISEDDFIARVLVMCQNYTSFGTGAVGMKDTFGSIDRAQAVVSLKNLSGANATVSVHMTMSPQNIVMANLLVPNGSGGTWTRAQSRIVKCNGSLDVSAIPIPSGHGVTIRVYGSRGHTLSPSRECSVSGTATFRWMEQVDCGDGNDVPGGCWSERHATKSLDASQVI